MVHKATPGIPLVVKAPEYNAAMEAGEWFARSQQLGTPRPRDLGGVNPCTVTVRNDTGGDLSAGDVVAITASELTTLDRQHLWFTGGVPTWGAAYGVLLHPIPNGAMGVAQVTGACLANVSVGDADHEWVHLDSGSTTLKSDWGGTARIAWKPSGTGAKQCVVELGRPGGPRRAVANADIAAGSSGSVSVYDSGSLGTIATAYNDWADSANVASADELVVEWFDADGKWRIRPSFSAGTSWPLVRLYSGSWKSQYSTTSYLLNGYPADCKFTYYNGDASACGITITGDGASAYNTPLLTFNASGGEYLIIPNIVGEINDSGVSYTQTVTTGAASAGTSHTHDVDCPIRHFATFTASLFKRASGATLWGAAKASSSGSTAVMKGNVFNGASNGTSFSCSPMYIRDITAGDELLLRCFAYHTPSSGTVYFTYSIVELTIIRVLEDDTQNTVT